jgi:hypothetical protein
MIFALTGFVALVAIAYQAWVTQLLVRGSVLERRQLRAQLVLVWLLPLLGAAICHWFYRLHAAYDPSSKFMKDETLPHPLAPGPVNDVSDHN